MAKNKIFKMLIAAVITAFSLVVANAGTVCEGKQIVGEPICFKDEVPTHPGAPKRNGRGMDKKPRFIKDHQGELLVYVSFEKEDCLKAYYSTLSEKQCNYLIGAINDKLMNEMGMEPLISKENLKTATLNQKKELIISAHSIGVYYGVGNILKSFSKKNRELANALFNELRCLANLKFFTKETEEVLYDPEKHYKISICETEPKKLTGFLGKDGHSVMNYSDNDDIIKQTLVVIDTHLQDIESLEESKILKINNFEHEDEINILLRNELEKRHPNLLYCQIFLALGLDHPRYSSYEEYKKYPSVSSKNRERNSIVFEECFGDDAVKLELGGVYPEKDKNEYLKLYQCLNLQTAPTPTDVKTLQQLFGASSDDSLECQVIRKNFKEKYASDLEVCYLGKAKDEKTGIYFADSTPLETCHIRQEKRGEL